MAQILSRLLHSNQLEDTQAGHAQKILATFPAAVQAEIHSARETPAAADKLVEPLSQRELQILQLINAGYTNQEIAERLVITLHTVKKHSSNIYGKLDVRNRTQAIAKARELRLL